MPGERMDQWCECEEIAPGSSGQQGEERDASGVEASNGVGSGRGKGGRKQKAGLRKGSKTAVGRGAGKVGGRGEREEEEEEEMEYFI